MAKNELLPFADGEDANVLPTNQWEALTDILENGFQSGIARSEQVNRVLAQGAVASYVLGQLIVDQLNKDAKLDKDTLYQNLILALQENAKDACLPLSGGTLTGKITSSSERVLDSTNDNGLFIVADANVSSTKTGTISVFPVGHSQANRAGGFQLVASDGTNNKTLTGSYANGLKWGDKNVVCSVNGSTADASGNVTISATPTIKSATVNKNKFYAPSGGTWYCFGYAPNNVDSPITNISKINGSYSGGALIGTYYNEVNIFCIKIA